MHSYQLFKHFLKPSDTQKIGLMSTQKDINYANMVWISQKEG